MIDLIVFLTLLALGYIFGRIAETRHFKSIQQREAELADVLAFSERLPPPSDEPRRIALVGGNVVISVDYFKVIAAGLRSIFGGRVRAFESLTERARREALLRMKQEARNLGAQMVVNVKLETASISKGNKGQVGAVEVYAYGTALIASPP
ncbi:YbjQ family protein [Litorivivens sp.]|uniref:YbjQ family protein n=1 Tax=Litorivivens sp. TaxID=2020868 RepID=UPI0035675317